MAKRPSIKSTRQKLVDEMEKYDPRSHEYQILAERLKDVTESQRNLEGWKAGLTGSVLPTIVQAIFSTIQTIGVLKHEDRGNVVTTKSLNYTQKMTPPRGK